MRAEFLGLPLLFALSDPALARPIDVNDFECPRIMMEDAYFGQGGSSLVQTGGPTLKLLPAQFLCRSKHCNASYSFVLRVNEQGFSLPLILGLPFANAKLEQIAPVYYRLSQMRFSPPRLHGKSLCLVKRLRLTVVNGKVSVMEEPWP
jgi:hypothetical protein